MQPVGPPTIPQQPPPAVIPQLPTTPQPPLQPLQPLQPQNNFEQRLAAIEIQLANLKPITGPAGPQGPPGRDGIDADTQAAISAAQYAAIAWLEEHRSDLRGPPGIPLEQSPFRIGVKDSTGKVTMPLTPVRPGNDVYLRITPPALKP